MSRAARRIQRAFMIPCLAMPEPVSWLAVKLLAGGPPAGPPAVLAQLLGPLIAFIAIPRIVAGPAVVVAEGLAMLLVRQRSMRIVLAMAVLMDLVPVGIYASRMASAMLR